MSLLITALMSNCVYAITQNYPTDYTYCYMPGYGSDWFANASDSPLSEGRRIIQSGFAAKIFRDSYNTSATPYYTNMWGTYSFSQGGAHEGLDVIYGGTGQPIKHWGSTGVITTKNATVGLVAVYCSSIGETIFYRHMNTVTSQSVGSTVYHGTQLGTQGSKGNSNGTHLHTGVEWGSRTSDSSGSDNNFSSQNPYYAMQLFGY